MRILGVIRLSRETDESTSPERQRDAVTKWAELHGHTIVGWAEDLDVSGDKNPWDRPDLGPWLRGQADEFDGIVGAKVDRLSRRLLHFVQLIEWAETRGKVVASATEPINTSDRFGRMISQMLAMFAEFERDAIKERAGDSQRKAREVGRWHGGTPPYGYKPERLPDAGWTLIHDPVSSENVREIVRRILGGSSMNAICSDFNSRGIPTPSDHYRQSVGKPMKGYKWKTTALIPMLRSRALLGEMEIAGKPVTSSDDLPVRRADPLLTYAEWKQIQDALEKLSKRKTRTASTAPLLHIAFCECGLPLYRVYASGNKGPRQHQYYRCKGRNLSPQTCSAKTMRADELERHAVESLLLLAGGLEMTEKRLIPGEDSAAKLEQIERRLQELRTDRDAGLFEGEDAEFQSRYLALRQRKRELEATPSIPDRWEEVPTGRTFREVWDGLASAEDQRAFLLSSGLRVTLHADPVRTRSLLPGLPSGESGGRVSVEIPHDLQRRVLDRVARTA
ncbi:recombinase family protein [Micromonospora sp. NPDC005367]|uniref:recombinase family protein n=1 Tax=Micromonospora sp. NPDC005367 TaxID=3155590 RepID=UPI0033A55B75